MKIYVIRHGESETNAAGRWTGWLDAPLTENGINDAKKASAILSDVCFDKVFSSDLCRAIKTAETALPEYEYEKSELLREIHIGTLENTLISDMTAEQRADVFENGYRNFGGESRLEFYNRIKTFMGRLEKLDLDNVAVFSHGGWLCGMLSQVFGVYVPRKNLLCNNCTVAIFEYQNENWRLHSWINL